MRPATGVACMLLAVAAASTLAACGDEEQITTCSKDEDCKNGYYCDTSTKTCKPKGNDAKIDLARDSGIGETVTDLTRDQVLADTVSCDQLPTDQALPDETLLDQYVHDQYVHDQYVHDQYVHDQLQPDLLRTNGTSCSSAGECISGFCSGNVCCDKACTGTCETCASSSSLGTCKLLAQGTACGASASCTGFTLVTNACDGTQSSCQTTSTQCDPYYCDSSGTACATSCTKSSDCTSKLCDPFDYFGTKGKCQPTSSVCYVHKTGSCGGGTLTSPTCFIQICLEKSPAPKYVAIIEAGNYTENLEIKDNTALVATESTAPLLVDYAKQSSAIKVYLEHSEAAKDLISNTLGKDLLMYGMGLRPSISSSSAYEKFLLYVKAGATVPNVEIRTCSFENPTYQTAGALLISIESSNAFVAPKASITDVALDGGCKGLYGGYSDISLQNAYVMDAGSKSSSCVWASGVEVKFSKLKVRDVLLMDNKRDGLYSGNSVLDIDRMKSVSNTNGMYVGSSTTGTISNILVADNTSKGIVLSTSNPSFLNVTVVNNGGSSGLEVDCCATCTTGEVNFYNSIIWDVAGDNNIYTTNCSFYYSDVRHSSSSPPSGSNNIPYANMGPQFIGTGTDPYNLTLSSPCVDYGLDTVTGFSPYPILDVLGKTRKVDKYPGKTPIVDCGAYELQ